MKYLGCIILFVYFLGPVACFVLEDCSSAQFFDIATFTCSSCPTSQVPDASGTACTCAAGYRKVFDDDRTFTCVSCIDQTKAPSRDQSRCMDCTAAGVTLGATDCECSTAGFALIELDSNGDYLSSKECVDCRGNTPGTYVDSESPYGCTPCPSNNMTSADGITCTCDTGYTLIGEECMYSTTYTYLSGKYTTSTKVEYKDILTTNGGATSSRTVSNSDVFSRSFFSSAVSCYDTSDREECEMASNLCVLQNYEKQSDACRYYDEIKNARSASNHGFTGWSNTLPWLYYADASSVYTSTDLKVQYSFEEAAAGLAQVPTSQLRIVLATFDYSGKYKGLQNLTSQLQLCNVKGPEAMQSFLRFGTSFENGCYLDLQSNILDASDPLFYDAYIIDGDNILYPLPVRLLNYRESGVLKNVNTAENMDFDDVLTRRFFMYDNLSGKTTSSGQPEVIRFADDVKLSFKLQPKTELGQLSIPVLEIHYSERISDNVKASATLPPVAESLSTPSVKFSVLYFMEVADMWPFIIMVCVLVGAVGLVLWTAKVYFYLRKERTQQIGAAFLGRAIQVATVIVGQCAFVVLVILSCYWYMSFKGQSVVSILLPDPAEDMTIFKFFLYVSVIAMCVSVVFLLYRQTHYDVFFIDWERSRGKIIERSRDDRPESSHKGRKGRVKRDQGDVHSKRVPVSVWRVLMIANEWAELEDKRLVSVEFSLFAVLFFLQGLGFEDYTASQPNTGGSVFAPQHPLLRYAVVSILWLAIAGIQVLYKKLIHHRFIVDPNGQFVDLLSLGNLSCFILSDHLSGYYIHGRSVHAHADADMLELTGHLKKEEDNLCSTRGLENDSDLQTFEVFITPDVRDVLDKLYTSSQQALSSRFNLMGAGNDQASGSSSNRRSGIPIASEQLVKSQQEVNRFLTSLVDKAQTEAGQVQYRTPLLQMLGVPPVMSQSKSSIFVKDTANSFSSVLFSGVESTLLVFNIVVFMFIDMISGPLHAVLVTYVIEQLVCWIRRKYGQRNISIKTLVPEAFLI